jgi:subtilisin-like proprotein convertase family protein
VNTSSNSPSGGASFTLNFSIPTGGVGSSTGFSNNTSTPIADNSTTNIIIPVSGFVGAIGKVALSMYATHTWSGDLDISLISPNNVVVPLTSDNGGSGDNYGTSCSPEGSRTTFDDDAATPITAGAAPFTGSFRPEGSLSDFDGLTGTDVNGNWTLRIVDDFAADIGTFLCGTIFLSATVCADGNGACAGGACAYEDLFDDGVLTYTQVKALVTETGGNLTLTPTTKKSYATSTGFAGIGNGTITSEIQYTAVTDPKGKGWMFTHWVDKKHLIEIQLNFLRNKVIIKQRNGVVLAKVKGNFTFAADTLYTVEANYDGTDYEVRINGTLVATLTPVGAVPSGILGYAARGLTEQVNRVCQTP